MKCRNPITNNGNRNQNANNVAFASNRMLECYQNGRALTLPYSRRQCNDALDDKLWHDSNSDDRHDQLYYAATTLASSKAAKSPHSAISAVQHQPPTASSSLCPYQSSSASSSQALLIPGTIGTDALLSVYDWVDTIPLSRPRKHLGRDFSDGVLLAEVIYHFFPTYIDLHNYVPSNRRVQKKDNWTLLRDKVLAKRLNLLLTNEMIEALTRGDTPTIEKLLALVKLRVENRQLVAMSEAWKPKKDFLLLYQHTPRPIAKQMHSQPIQSTKSLPVALKKGMPSRRQQIAQHQQRCNTQQMWPTAACQPVNSTAPPHLEMFRSTEYGNDGEPQGYYTSEGTAGGNMDNRIRLGVNGRKTVRIENVQELDEFPEMSNNEYRSDPYMTGDELDDVDNNRWDMREAKLQQQIQLLVEKNEALEKLLDLKNVKISSLCHQLMRCCSATSPSPQQQQKSDSWGWDKSICSASQQQNSHTPTTAYNNKFRGDKGEAGAAADCYYTSPSMFHEVITMSRDERLVSLSHI